ncbi:MULTISPECIES: hypothetical protein [Ralstonia]|jgi:hypothetical protein|uniref:Uncharacterized protein n=2 Tax=Ralstonia pickettii TaxID=329 RepID=R0CMQ3_RALPI|nr:MULTISPECIES: hypothetical protein [Ralstonia]ENZ77735.1 hypothetical protein OR214_02011 [Ralstonia pickettii OR214]MBL4779237.1 hypothetical protein [Ralstonia sp.]MCM3583864.1 hypothetical protein [Ralstonia pickettii]
MPTSTVWVEPQVFLTYRDVTVYHAYEADDIAQGACKYSYTTNNTTDEEHFDVRYLEVPGVALLEKHPPFLAADCNPEFATATDEQKAEWQRQWADWRKEGGGEDQAIITIIKEGIDLGLITAPVVE